MNGYGLLITLFFCGLTYWGTSSYYKDIIRMDARNTNRIIDEFIKGNRNER